MNTKGLTPAQIAKLLKVADEIQPIINAVRERAIQLAHAGIDLPGYEPDFTTPRRKWADEEKANELLAGLGLSTKERYSVDLLSPSQAEKVLRSKKLWPKLPRGSTAKKPNPLAGVVTYTDSNPTIRKASKES